MHGNALTLCIGGDVQLVPALAAGMAGNLCNQRHGTVVLQSFCGGYAFGLQLHPGLQVRHAAMHAKASAQGLAFHLMQAEALFVKLHAALELLDQRCFRAKLQCIVRKAHMAAHLAVLQLFDRELQVKRQLHTPLGLCSIQRMFGQCSQRRVTHELQGSPQIRVASCLDREAWMLQIGNMG